MTEDAGAADGSDARQPSPSALQRPRAMGGRSRPRLLLLIEREANRRQLASWLADRYEVESPPIESFEESIERADLCLVDTAAYRSHRTALTATRAAVDPVFFPVLLVLPEAEWSSLGDDVWSVVDDVVGTPIRQAELAARIEVLLRARRLSVDLKRRNDRLEKFAGTVSHDLRNPLTIARGFLDIAQESGELDHLDRVDRALDRMQDIIDDVLALSRSGTMIGDRERVDLTEAADAAWANVATGSATLEVELDQFTVEGEETRLGQLFENLFRNAVEHGGEDVTVRLGRFDRGFFVEDDGPGIPDEDRRTVFEYGYSTIEGGTGFGLAIVAGVAEAHGWAVQLTEGTSGGARFEIVTEFESVTETDPTEVGVD